MENTPRAGTKITQIQSLYNAFSTDTMRPFRFYSSQTSAAAISSTTREKSFTNLSKSAVNNHIRSKSAAERC